MMYNMCIVNANQECNYALGYGPPPALSTTQKVEVEPSQNSSEYYSDYNKCLL